MEDQERHSIAEYNVDVECISSMEWLNLSGAALSRGLLQSEPITVLANSKARKAA